MREKTGKTSARRPSDLSHTNTQKCMIPRKIKYFLIPITMVLMFSCQRTLADRYTEEELANIMLDAHTLGLIYNRQESKSDTLKVAYYEVIESRYGLSREEFQKLVRDLTKNSVLYDKVYGRMVKKAEQMEQKSMETF